MSPDANPGAAAEALPDLADALDRVADLAARHGQVLMSVGLVQYAMHARAFLLLPQPAPRPRPASRLVAAR